MADSGRGSKTVRSHGSSEEPAEGPEPSKRARAEEEEAVAAAVAAAMEATPKPEEEQRRPRRIPQDRPHLATRNPEFLDPKLVEAIGRMSINQNETIVAANYYALSTLDGSRFASNIRFHRFDVTFEPFAPRFVRRNIMHRVNDKYYPDMPLAFDGNTLCFVPAAKAESTELCKQDKTTVPIEYELQGRTQTTNVCLTWTSSAGSIQPEDGSVFLQAFNTCVKRALCKQFQLKMFSDSLWDLKNRDSISVGGQTYELVRGYDITVKATQAGLYLNVDDRSRIFKQGTVYEWMQTTRSSNKDDYKRIISDRLRNSILYNIVGNELFRVSEVHFDKHPVNFMFNWRRRGPDGRPIESQTSIAKYYLDRYGKKVVERQPLIEVLPEYRLKPNATEQEKLLYESRKNLIPSDLCLFTGLDAAEKANFQLMKRINEYTKPLAMKKKLDLDAVVKKYLFDDTVQKDLATMNIKIDADERSEYGLSVGLRARVIVPPVINMGGNVLSQIKVSAGRNGPAIGFETEVRSKPRVASHAEDFVIAFITTQRDEQVLQLFYTDFVQKAAHGMSMAQVFGIVKTFYSNGPRTSDFSAAMEDCCKFCIEKKKIPFIFILVPDELKERYDQIKQVSLAQFGMLSQVLRFKTIAQPKLAVATKVVLQVAAKMGSVMWALHAPTLQSLKSLMMSSLIVGIDVHHDGERKGSVQVCVGTLDMRASTFYQRSRLVARGEEISRQNDTYAEWIRDMIRERKNAQKSVDTEVIVIYRDGVSEGQIELALNTEYSAINKSLADWPVTEESSCPYKPGKQPKIIFIFVMKRHSTRFFQWNAGGDTTLTVGGARGGYSGGGGRGGGRGGFAAAEPTKKFENPTPGTVVNKGIVRSDRAEFYLAAHDTKEGVVCPMRYEILRNETQPPVGMSDVEAAALGYRNYKQSDIEDLTFYLTALYPNQCATISVPVVCQLAQKFAMLSGQHLHSDVVNLQQNLRKKMFYL